jgi:hypothetical protein
LINYKPGSPENKPDVLQHIKQIEEERKNIQQQPVISISKPGEESRPMTMQEIAEILKQQQNKIKELQSIQYHIELEKRDKKISVIEKLMQKLKDDNETKDIEIKDLEYKINKMNDEKIINLEETKSLEQNIFLKINKDTQTENNNTDNVKLLVSKIIPEVPINVSTPISVTT